MALPAGHIKFSDINTSFGASTNAKRVLSSCYNFTSGVAGSGALWMSTLRGKSRIPQTYPPVALTSASTTVTGKAYGNGAYNITASSQYFDGSEAAWMAFNKGSGIWTNGNHRMYSQTSPFAYTGSISTTVSGSACSGEWLQIQFPSAVTVMKYTVVPRSGFLNRGPRDFTLAGSTDGTTWTRVDTQASISNWTDAGIAFSVKSPGSYSMYRLVVNALAGTEDWLSINELSFSL